MITSRNVMILGRFNIRSINFSRVTIELILIARIDYWGIWNLIHIAELSREILNTNLIDFLTGIIVATIVLYNSVYNLIFLFSLIGAIEFREEIARRIEESRRREYDDSLSLLIPQPGEKTWGEKRVFGKVEMIAEVVGYRHRIARKKDKICMDKYLDGIDKMNLDVPGIGRKDDYLPMGAPILDYLTENVRAGAGWKYPKLEDLESYQSNRGLSWDMLDQVEVRELICGVSSEEEIKDTHHWLRDQYDKDQERFGTRIISMDVEDVFCTHYDILRMAGDLEITTDNSVLNSKPETYRRSGLAKDVHKNIPGKLMIGNGISWALIISLDLHRNEKDEYLLERMSVQPGLLNLLRDLPVSAGLGVRRDVREIEEFYSTISGVHVELANGFIDLASMAVAAGYKFHAKNMTALGVQILGTLLNKTVSTGDDLWGLPWAEIPASLQVYGLGDLKFGFIVYNVLAGVLLRDLFPDPDIVCRYLECDQEGAVNWFLDWLVLSLEGTEFHADSEERAVTRIDLLKSLRHRDSRDKLASGPPPYIMIWTRLLGSWPSITQGGCRFLIQCREWFLVQIRILARARLQWMDGRVLRLPAEDDLMYARFGLSPEQLGSPDWRQPARPGSGMGRPREMPVAVVRFDPSTTRSSEIGRLCSELGRPQRWAILEWARLFPEKLQFFFNRMARDKGFRVFYRSIYDCLRLLYLRIFGQAPVRVMLVEKQLNECIDRMLDQERSALERCEIEVVIRRSRVLWLEEVKSDWKFKERSRWKSGLTPLPSWKRKFSQKRSGSVSNGKGAGQPKEKKVKLAEEESVLVPVQIVLDSSKVNSAVRAEDSAASSVGVLEMISKSVQTDEITGAGRSRDLSKKKVGGFRSRSRSKRGDERKIKFPPIGSGKVRVPGSGDVKKVEKKSYEPGSIDDLIAKDSMEVIDEAGDEVGDVGRVVDVEASIDSCPILTTRRRERSSSRSRVLAVPRVLTYDERIEAENRFLEEDEFEFELNPKESKF